MEMLIGESRDQPRWLVLYLCDGLCNTTDSVSSGQQLPTDILINCIL